MPKIRDVEKRIFNIEGFEVVIRGQDKKDKRGDAEISRQYEASRMTRNSFSVGEWKEKFKRQFAGLEVDVLKGDGKKASGQMKLSTVRDTYLLED